MGWLEFIVNMFGKNTKKKKLNIILFGPPGSGKGTQAVRLADTFDLIHISTGDLFRYELGNNTPLGEEARKFMDQGLLVPDQITIGMLKNRMEKDPEAKGFIFDGFPRTINQAKALDELLEEMNDDVDQLIFLEVGEEEIINRLLERGKSSGRSDDANEEVIRNRLKVYQDETAPVREYYRIKNRVKNVSGMGDINEINARLSEAINEI